MRVPNDKYDVAIPEQKAVRFLKIEAHRFRRASVVRVYDYGVDVRMHDTDELLKLDYDPISVESALRYNLVEYSLSRLDKTPGVVTVQRQGEYED